jgi:hypothetical protein
MSAPRWANFKAIAAPMPRLDPVTVLVQYDLGMA